MAIRTESELLWKQFKALLYAIVTLPYHLIELLIHPHKLSHKTRATYDWFKEFHRWFMETKVTAWLVIINVIIFPISVIFFPEQLWYALALYPEALFSGNVFQLISSAFLHADIWHLLSNMVVLVIMGRVVEKHLGHWGAFLVYFGSMLISGVASASFYHMLGMNVGAIGASGAIAGMTSAAILLRPFYFTYLLFGIPVPVMLIGWLFIVQDALAILNPVEGDNVGHIAHMGGYIAIALLVWLLSRESKRKLLAGLIANIIVILLTVLVYNFWLAGSLPWL